MRSMREPAAAFRRVGLNPFRAEEAAASWNELRTIRRLHLLLAPHGLAYLAKRISDEYPNTAHRVITENPYELTRVFGVGFKVADRIARAHAESVDAIPGRVSAALVYALSEAEGRGGSTCLPVGQLLAAARDLLGQLPDEEAIEQLVEDGDLVRDGDWIYRTPTWELEQELGERVLTMLGEGAEGKLGAVGDEVLSGGELTLTPEQEAGVRGAFQHRLSVITGGPGTGKTASIRTIAKLAEAQGAKVLLVAPTGRAARRMTEASGVDAKTVHSALGWVPGELPEHDEDDPLPYDLLIVDESSMANLELMVTLLRAVAPRAHVVLVGDADQLAPVGAGKPFADLVASEVVPTARLSHIFRQAAGSMIVQGAHAIRRGEVPEFKPAEGMRHDLFLMERRERARRTRADRGAGQRTAAQALRGGCRRGHPGVRARVQGRSRDRCAEPRAARRVESERQAGRRRAPADRRQADDDRAQPAREGPDERDGPVSRGRDPGCRR